MGLDSVCSVEDGSGFSMQCRRDVGVKGGRKRTPIIINMSMTMSKNRSNLILSE
jgi:hypothetical protein